MEFRISERLASKAELREIKATLERFGCRFHRDGRQGLVCTVADERLRWGVAGGLASYLEAHGDVIVWPGARATAEVKPESGGFTVPWQLAGQPGAMLEIGSGISSGIRSGRDSGAISGVSAGSEPAPADNPRRSPVSAR